MLAGDAVADALNTVGITSERVQRLLGRPCGGCERRREKLNQLHMWASMVVRRKIKNGREVLERILSGWEEEDKDKIGS